MSEFLVLLPPREALNLLLSNLNLPLQETEVIDSAAALDRVTGDDVVAPHPLPAFPRSTVDGYAVRAGDTFGASEALPAYLHMVGEVPMGTSPRLRVGSEECQLIHTGGMIPEGSDAVVMLEHAQTLVQGVSQLAKRPRPEAPASEATEVQVLKSVAVGENVIQIGEDVRPGDVVVGRGTRLTPAHIGGLMALGLTSATVVRKPRIGLISSGDEVVPPRQEPRPGQVRDVNAYALSAALTRWGGVPTFYGIVPDQVDALQRTAERALQECDCLLITAGSSASSRDQTAQVVNALGRPGVLVHGINTKPGKPTILGACDGKGVIGLPGNPVSALVNAFLFVLPIMEGLLGMPFDRPRPAVTARLAINLASAAGREDWWPVRLKRLSAPLGAPTWTAEPIFGRSNLIFTLAAADGLLPIPADVTGLSAGASVDVVLLWA